MCIRDRLKTLGLYEDVSYRFSQWDPKDRDKYIGTAEQWDEAQGIDVYKRQAIILCAVVIRNDGGDIFICPCGRSAVIQRNRCV